MIRDDAVSWFAISQSRPVEPTPRAGVPAQCRAGLVDRPPLFAAKAIQHGTHQGSSRQAPHVVHRVQVHDDERRRLPGGRSAPPCLAWRDPNAFPGASFCWKRGRAHPHDWYDGCGHRLVIFVRRSFGLSTIRRRFRGRPIGVRTSGARAPGDSRRVSSFAGDVRDFSTRRSPLVPGAFSVAIRDARAKLPTLRTSGNRNEARRRRTVIPSPGPREHCATHIFSAPPPIAVGSEPCRHVRSAPSAD